MSIYLSTLLSTLSILCQRLITLSIFIGAILSISISALACQLPNSYYKNVSCTSDENYFLAVKDSGQPVAIIDDDGRQVINLFRYTLVDASKINNGVMPVQYQGKVGYIDIQGREVVAPIYDVLTGDPQTNGWARKASDNLIVVKKGGRFGVISTTNQTIVPFSSSYRSFSDFENGVATAQKSSDTVWIATNGRFIPSPNGSHNADASSITSTQPSLYSQASAAVPSSALSATEAWQPDQKEGKWGFVNSNKVAMIRFAFDEVTPFSEGIAGVRIDKNWGFIDASGALIIPFRFNDAGVIRPTASAKKDMYSQPFVFYEGKAWIGNLNDGSKLCIDKKGTNVICDGIL